MGAVERLGLEIDEEFSCSFTTNTKEKTETKMPAHA